MWKRTLIFLLFLLKLIIIVNSEVKAATTYEPIRITFDTTYLSNDPERICLKVGDRFKRGTPFSNDIICGGFTENCYQNCKLLFFFHLILVIRYSI